MRRALLLALLTLALTGAACVTLRESKGRYAATQDYASLKRLARRLKPGMTKAEVVALLGEPLEHPGNGQYCYLSDRTERAGEFDVPLGLIVSYNDDGGRETDRLQAFFFVPVAE